MSFWSFPILHMETIFPSTVKMPLKKKWDGNFKSAGLTGAEGNELFSIHPLVKGGDNVTFNVKNGHLPPRVVHNQELANGGATQRFILKNRNEKGGVRR